MLLSEKFDAALSLASELHRGQRRKSTSTPYISHLLAVCSMVLEDGGNETEAIAAILHDAVEDQGGRPTLDRVEKEFGKDVAEIVEMLSDSFGGEKKPPWQERKDRYLSNLGKESSSVHRIAVCDKLHNLSSILRDYRNVGEVVWERFNQKAGPEGQLWYYEECLKIFKAKKLQSRWLDDFESTVVELRKIIS